jgi:hypothetical protein
MRAGALGGAAGLERDACMRPARSEQNAAKTEALFV